MKGTIFCTLAFLLISNLEPLYAQSAIKGIVDVKVTQKRKVEGYEKIRDWYTDSKNDRLYLFVKYGESDKVLTDMLVYNCGPGNNGAVGAPKGYTNVGHWDTEGSTDAFDVRNDWMLNLCVKYGTDKPLKSVVISNGKKGSEFESRGEWKSGGRQYRLYVEPK